MNANARIKGQCDFDYNGPEECPVPLSLLIHPIELAKLAAIIDPKASQSNPQTALRAALELYRESIRFLKAPDVDRYDADIVSELLRRGFIRESRMLLAEKVENALDADMLVLYRDHSASDEVRAKLNVKKWKSALDNIEAFVQSTYKSKSRGKDAFKAILREAAWPDPHSVAFWKFESLFIEQVVAFKKEKKRQGGLKSVRTAASK